MKNWELLAALEGLRELIKKAESMGPFQKAQIAQVAVNNAVELIGELVAREVERGEKDA